MSAAKEETAPLLPEQLVAKQGEAFAQIHSAPSGPILTHVEKQQRHVALSMARCPRCGEHVVTFFPAPPLSVLCVACRAFARSLDGAVRWFDELIYEADKKRRARTGDKS